MKKWKNMEKDTSEDILRMIDKENQLNYTTLSNFYTTSTTLEKGIIISATNCELLYLDIEQFIEIHYIYHH
jgi:hypothetical protein